MDLVVGGVRPGRGVARVPVSEHRDVEALLPGAAP
jgi:hypothetical protein